MARMSDIAIDLASITPEEWAVVCVVAESGGVDPATVTLAQLAAGTPPLPVLAGLIFITLRRTEPGITPGRCARLAAATLGVAGG